MTNLVSSSPPARFARRGRRTDGPPSVSPSRLASPAPTCSTEPTGSELRVYVDSSALIKRSVQEAESDALEAMLDRYVADDAVIVSSSLAWIEVTRALRARLHDGSYGRDEIDDAIEGALSGVAERLITGEVVGLARRVAPPLLRTLDAVHLATALLLDADVVVAYDARLGDACEHNGLTITMPGR